MRVYVGQKSSSMNSISRLTNRVQRTRFTSPETEFIELSLQAQKPSPLYSVSFESTCPLSHALKKFLKTQKHSISKNTVSHSHSLSLSVSLSLSLSSQSQSLSHSHSLAPSPSRSVSHSLSLLSLRRCRRRRRCLSLPSLRLRLAQSFSLNGWL